MDNTVYYMGGINGGDESVFAKNKLPPVLERITNHLKNYDRFVICVTYRLGYIEADGNSGKMDPGTLYTEIFYSDNIGNLLADEIMLNTGKSTKGGDKFTQHTYFVIKVGEQKPHKEDQEHFFARLKVK